MTDVHKAVTAGVPMKQLVTQFWSAITRCGLTPQDVMGMKAETHGAEIASLMNALISAAELDQVLFFIHSFDPASTSDLNYSWTRWGPRNSIIH